MSVVKIISGGGVITMSSGGDAITISGNASNSPSVSLLVALKSVCADIAVGTKSKTSSAGIASNALVCKISHDLLRLLSSIP